MPRLGAALVGEESTAPVPRPPMTTNRKRAIQRAKLCPYCNGTTRRASGDEIYPHLPHLSKKRFMCCRQFPECDAYVGQHADGKPLGRLANRKLRWLKGIVHDEFDTLWQKGPRMHFETRRDAYRWLAEVMELPSRLCHVGQFNEEQCTEALKHVRQLRDAIRSQQFA